MKKLVVFVVAAYLCFGIVSSSYSEPIVYPAKGQSPAQQSKDQGECGQWATQQTGVDPVQLAQEASSGEVYQRHHSALGGAARGALLGVIGGAIAGDAGKGAAIGAGVGAVAGRMGERGTWRPSTRAMQTPMRTSNDSCKPMTAPIPPV